MSRYSSSGGMKPDEYFAPAKSPCYAGREENGVREGRGVGEGE